MTITKTELIDVMFLESERNSGIRERKRLQKLGFTSQGEDKLNGKIHEQFLRITDVTPVKYE